MLLPPGRAFPVRTLFRCLRTCFPGDFGLLEDILRTQDKIQIPGRPLVTPLTDECTLPREPAQRDGFEFLILTFELLTLRNQALTTPHIKLF